MALPASGQISLSQVNTELGRPATQAISMNETEVRGLFGVASGGIGMSNGHGKSNRVTINLTISANTQNYNVFNNKGASYVAGKSDVTITINTGVYVGATSTGVYALDTGTGWTAGDTVRIINNGYIMGAGGQGGWGGGYNSSGYAGAAGGPALRTQVSTNITNANGYIYGGGGGGGGSEGGHTSGYGSGGGGGGGQGYVGGGGGGAVGGNPTGQGGGAGSPTAPGGGGAGGYAWQVRGGTGGTAGNAGSFATTQWYSSGTPGAAGVAITGNANVTWTSGNTRVYGGIVA